jgi:hypothetical protein
VTIVPPSPAPSDGTNLRGRSVTLIVALLIVAGFAFRIHTAIGRYEKGDSIIYALMANDIAQGVQYPLWFYGSPYSGSLESWLTAPLIWATGPSWGVIPFVPIVVSTAGIAAFYLLGSAIGGTRAGLFAATLWAFAPWGASFYNTSPRGCYPETICGGAMILWYATLRWKGERMSVAVSLMTGLLAGVLIWSRLLVAPYVITLAIILLLVDRARFFNIRNMAGVAGIVIGAFPFLLAWKQVMAQNAVGRIEISGLGERVRALYATLLEGYAPDDGTQHVLAAPASWASLVFSLGATFAFIAMAAFALARRSKTRREITTVPLALFTLIFAGIYLSNTASLASQVRYALPLCTAILIFPALAADWLAGRSRVLGMAVIIFLAGSATAVTEINFAAVKMAEAPIRDQVRGSIAQLQNLGVRSLIINDYNLMCRFFYEALASGYPLNVMRNSGNLNMRWTMAVERDPDPVHLMSHSRAGQFAQWLASCCGGDHINRDIAGFAGIHQIKVVTWPSVSIPPAQWNISPDGRALADRLHGTTFYSSQREEVVIAFDRPRNLTKVRLVYGNRFPETVTLERSLDGDSWERISGPQPPSMLYPVGATVYERLSWGFDREHEEWNFPPKPATRLRLTFDPHGGGTYDLHELFIYESSGETWPEPSADEIRQAVERTGVTTLACDRRVASLFFGQRVSFRATILPFIEADPELAKPQWKTGPGFAALADRADADELAERLKNQKAVFSVTPLGNKTLFAFKEEAGLMWWTGFTLIAAP